MDPLSITIILFVLFSMWFLYKEPKSLTIEDITDTPSAKESADKRKEQIARGIAIRQSRGNVLLQEGLVLTEKDQDEELKKLISKDIE